MSRTQGSGERGGVGRGKKPWTEAGGVAHTAPSEPGLTACQGCASQAHPTCQQVAGSSTRTGGPPPSPWGFSSLQDAYGADTLLTHRHRLSGPPLHLHTHPLPWTQGPELGEASPRPRPLGLWVGLTNTRNWQVCSGRDGVPTALVPTLPHHGSPRPFPPKGPSPIRGHSSLGLSTPPSAHSSRPGA